MFGFGRLGPMELILILVIALVVFGPKKLPEIGKALGKALREFKTHTSKLQEDLDISGELESIGKLEDPEKKKDTEASPGSSSGAEKTAEKVPVNGAGKQTGKKKG